LFILIILVILSPSFFSLSQKIFPVGASAKLDFKKSKKEVKYENKFTSFFYEKCAENNNKTF
jgi:hypothetical protein